jgi:hypothetical protein
MFNLSLNGSRDSMKQSRTHRMSQQPKNKVKLNPKSIPRSKGDKTRVEHKKEKKRTLAKPT